MKAKTCPDNSHPVCISSDSNLPECKCWCAECQEMMREIRKARENASNFLKGYPAK